MAAQSFYPPAPDDVPEEITQLDSGYRLRVLAMIGGLFLFLIVYLAFIAGTAFFAYWLLTLPMPVDPRSRNEGAAVMLKIGGVITALLLLAFLVKGLFKGQRSERKDYVELLEEDHPRLFKFIRRVYEDVGAPRPRSVYVSSEVNAAVIYNSSLINLFVSPKKDLLIGLGLVNVVTLAEFKAVLAHEFGHFAQRSVGLGSYLYVANRVMTDIVYSRDGLDRFLDNWCRIDLRLSFPAWALKGVLWVVRKILAGVFKALNLLHLSLGRQMEYKADNVAVSVCGSDALIHGLARSEFANECLVDAAQSLSHAADHALFSDDLFHHQTHAADRLRKLRKDERAGLPPELPANPRKQVEVFPPVEDGIPDRYRSHPTNHMREKNAKRFYVRSPLDERSPWLLFGDAADLKQKVTRLFYKHLLRRQEKYRPEPAEEVQQFIDAEHAETTYDAKYQGMYDDRFINPGDLERLPSPWSRADVVRWLSDWPPADLEQQVACYRKRQDEINLLQGLQSGQLALKGKSFTFRDREYSFSDVTRLIEKVDRELGEDTKAFHRLDREVFLAYWSLACHRDDVLQNRNLQDELLERYQFHMSAQGLLQKILGEQARLQGILAYLSKNQQLPQEDFRAVVDVLREIHTTIKRILRNSKDLATPELTNVPAGCTVYSVIVDRVKTDLPELEGDSISGEWLNNLLTRLDGVLSRMKRLHFKSLGSLLAFQESMSQRRARE